MLRRNIGGFAGLLTSADYFDIIRRQRPEQILFARFQELRDFFSSRLRDDYELVYEGPASRARLCVRKELVLPAARH